MALRDRPARPHSHTFLDANLQPREAKVNEYFYKSDAGPVVNPYAFQGKDGRIYNNYRPDHGVPLDQMTAPSASLHHELLVPSPAQIPTRSGRFLMRREAGDGPSFLQKVFNPRYWGAVKRNDVEMAGSEYYGYGVRPPVWNGYQADWAASNISPVPTRIHPSAAHPHPHPHAMQAISPSAPIMTRYNPMESPINMNNWYSFLNSPMFGPMAGHTFPTMEGPTVDGQPMSSMESLDKPASGGSGSGSGNSGNSSEESGEKKPSSRQRSRWQLNLSRIPIANLKNLFRINPTTSTTTTESSESV